MTEVSRIMAILHALDMASKEFDREDYRELLETVEEECIQRQGILDEEEEQEDL